MLTLLAMALMTLCPPQTSLHICAKADSIVRQRQDTVRGERSATILRNGAPQGMPGLRSINPSYSYFDQYIHQIPSAELDSLLQSNPTLRDPILRELLIPPDQTLGDQSLATLTLFYQMLARDSNITPFERMSLIAKRYADTHPSDNSMKRYQLEIMRTIRWLEDVLK